ncbi:MAG: nucleotidyltransferase domain-containing protein [Candidatus Limnocylindria bacterium]
MPSRSRSVLRGRSQLGARIAEARALRGLSQHALASDLRVDRSAISKMESASRGVSSHEIAEIARVTGKPVDWFLSGDASVHRMRREAAEGAGLLRLVRRKRNAIETAAGKHGARRLRLFGSTARGDAVADSDVDFLVQMDEGRTLLDQAAFLLELQSILGRSVDVVTEAGLRDRIRARVLSEAIPL